MGKIIAAINMTLNGIFDHDAISPNEDVHDHYTALIRQSDLLLYGRVTYELMTFWKELVEKPSGQTSMDEFALVMDQKPKIVYAHSPLIIDWHSASQSKIELIESVKNFKLFSNEQVLVCSRSLIIQLIDANLIDEFQICIHPVIAVTGRPLFEKVRAYTHLRLINTKVLKGGAVIHYYHLLPQ